MFLMVVILGNKVFGSFREIYKKRKEIKEIKRVRGTSDEHQAKKS